MSNQSKTFRIFISSTFSDLKAERNALQEHVFPRLRQLAEAHGCRFQAIDLRWGVSEEAALDQQTMKICLGEIERCQKVTPRPNFIVLLGDRYGWRPPPPQIPRAEFDAILERVSDPRDQALLVKWYRLDENAVPAEYCLQPREGEMTIDEQWAFVERQLQHTLETAAHKLQLGPHQLLKYTTSATEQEIENGALRIADAREHVYCFFRKIEGLPQDPTAEGFIDLDTSGHQDRVAAQKLSGLKSRLENLLKENVYHYSAEWLGDGTATAHIGALPGELVECMPMLADGYTPKNLCEAVWCSLARVIQKELALLEDVDPLQAEIDAHAAFAAERARVFVGRTDPLAKIAAYLAGSDRQPLLIWGEAGCGKSALMARAIQQAVENHPNAQVIYRFIGATPDSPDTRTLLENLLRQITQAYGGDEENIPSEYNKLIRFFTLIRDFFAQLFKPGSPIKPLLIFIDALDQLVQTDDPRYLDWIPEELPGGVHLVVSTLSGAGKKILERRVPEKHMIELPPLSPDQGRELLDIWLAEAGRTLQPDQRTLVLSGFMKNGLPLYLKLACEKAHLWKSYTPEPSLRPDVSGMTRELFSRLGSEASHGDTLVAHVLGYLAAARNGLSEDELLDLLARDEEVKADFLRRSPKSPKIDRLPVVVWSRLYFDLKPYLVERSVHGALCLSFFHRQMAEMAAEIFLSGEVKRTRHQALVEYFASQSQFKGTDDVNSPNRHAVFELPYQQTMAEKWPELEATLTNIFFIAAKCSAGLSLDLQRDFSLAQERRRTRMPAAPFSKTFKDFAVFAADQANNLDLHPELIFQQALLYARDSAVFLAAEKLWQSGDYRQPRLVLINKPDFKGDWHGTDKVRGKFDACVISPDGKKVAYTRGEIIEIWDVNLGVQTATLSGHAERVFDCAFTPDNQRLVSASWDNTLKLWDVRHAKLLATFTGHTQAVRALAISPDGRRLLSGSDDHTIILWDLVHGTKIHQLAAHQDEIRGCAFDPGGHFAISGSYDGGFRLWVIERGEKFVGGRGHAPHLDTCTFSPDGRRIAIGFQSKHRHPLVDCALELWDHTQTGARIANLSEGSRGIHAIAVSPDGQLIYTACGDGTIRVWDARSGVQLESLPGHKETATDCSLSPDGQLLASSAMDATLRLWDAKKWTEIGLLGSKLDERFLKGVHTGVFSSDGKRIAVGAYNGMLNLFDVESGAKIAGYDGEGVLRACVFSPDNSTITQVSDNNTISTWGTNDGMLIARHEGDTRIKEMRSKIGDLQKQEVYRQLGLTPRTKSPTFPGLQNELFQQLELGARVAQTAACAGAISLDNQQVMLGYPDGRLKLQNTKQHTIKTLMGHQQAVSACAFSPDGRWIASASNDGILKVWDAERGIETSTLSGHQARINACAFSCDGQWIVSASDDKTLIIWQTASGKQRITLSGHLDSVLDCAFSPDGCHVVSASKDNTLRIWEAGTGVELKKITSQTGAFHTCSYSPDGRKIFSATKGYFLAIWDAASGNQLVELGGHQKAVKACCFSSDGQRIVSASIDDTIRIWDVRRKALVKTIPIRDVKACKFSPHGDWIIVAAGKSLEIWDASNYVKIATLEGHTGAINACDVSPDGKKIVTASGDRSLKLWDANDWSEIRSMSGHERSVNTCAFSPDGRWIVSASRDGTIRQWDVLSGVQTGKWAGGHHGEIKSCTCSPDGETILSAADDGWIVIWDAEKRGEFSRFGCSYAANTGIYEFFPDGKTIASALSDQTIKIWNVENGASVKQLGETRGIGAGCKVSPDGNFILSHKGSWLRIWDARQDKQVASLIAESHITSYNWCPAGNVLAAHDLDGNMYLLKLEGANLGAPYVTARFSWKNDTHGFGCPWCYRWSPIPESALGNTIACPNCGHPVRLNSFTIRSDWAQISAAWSGSSAQINGDTDEFELQEFLGVRAIHLYEQGYPDSALRLFRIQENICREKNYPYGLQNSLGYQAMILKNRNELDAALNLLKEHRGICKTNKFMEWLQWSLDTEGLIYFEQGDLEKSLPLYQEHGEICRARDDKSALQFSLGRQGLIFYKLGDFDRALPLFVEREHLCREIGEKSGLYSSICNQGLIYYERGNLADAIKYYKAAEDICRSINDNLGLSICLGNRGEALQASGDLDGAMAVYKEQEYLCREQNYTGHLKWSLENQASILEMRGDRTGAGRLREEVMHLNAKESGN